MDPVIVLVRPQLGENIGKAARAMLNFGLTEMRLVSPRDGWPNPSAGPAASGADIVLEQAQVYETVADAVADCEYVHATTVRKRGVTKPVLTPEEAAREMASELLRHQPDFTIKGYVDAVPSTAEFRAMMGELLSELDLPTG